VRKLKIKKSGGSDGDNKMPSRDYLNSCNTVASLEGDRKLNSSDTGETGESMIDKENK
jgi:hypothetical protein